MEIIPIGLGIFWDFYPSLMEQAWLDRAALLPLESWYYWSMVLLLVN